MGYDYEIVYKLGQDNSVADSLSRKSGSLTLHHMFTPQVHLWDEIREASKGDPYITQMGCEAAAKPEGQFKTSHGLVFYKTEIVVPKAPVLHNKILEEFHASKTAGHSGVLRTYKILTQQFYWPTMYKDVQEFVAQCEACQRTKTEALTLAGLLQPLPIPCQVWDDITMDFIEGMPKSHGRDTILVVVDRLSKYAHFLDLTHPFTTKVVADTFVESMVKLLGMPKSIISDRDPIFV